LARPFPATAAGMRVATTVVAARIAALVCITNKGAFVSRVGDSSDCSSSSLCKV
jgi:hypothetical protein